MKEHVRKNTRILSCTPVNIQTPHRFVTLDMAKGLCILLVVIGHYHPENSPLWYNELWKVIYSFHMPLFLFASGYLYIATKKQEAYFGFLRKKVYRLMIPYLSTSLLLVSLKLLAQGQAYVENPVTWASYLKILYRPEAGFFLWFIWALWWMFVLLPLCKGRTSRSLLFVLSVLLYFLPVELPEVFCLSICKRMFLYFMLGVVLYDWRERLDFVRKIPAAAVYALFIAAECLLLSGIVPAAMAPGFSLMVAVAGVGAVMKLAAWMAQALGGKFRKIWLQIAASSYIIYLFHTTFEGFAKSAIRKIPVWSDGENSLFFAIGAGLVVGCGVVFPILLHTRLLQRFRITRLLFGLK